MGALFVLVMHFTLTLVYSIPDVKFPESLKQASNNYMVPWFHQGWKLFAPDVPNYQVFLRYKVPKEGKWGSWQEPHALDSFRNHSRVYYMSKKIGWMLMNDLQRNSYLDSLGQRQYDRITPATPYLRCLYYVTQHHKRLHNEPLDSIQMGLDIQYAPDFHSGEIRDTSHFDFPIYRFND
jgi:hypothetical protein